MLCTFPSGSIQVRTVPTVPSIDVDSCFINLDTGTMTVSFDDGTQSAVKLQAQFQLSAPLLSNIQTFVKNKLSNKLGVALT